MIYIIEKLSEAQIEYDKLTKLIKFKKLFICFEQKELKRLSNKLYRLQKKK